MTTDPLPSGSPPQPTEERVPRRTTTNGPMRPGRDGRRYIARMQITSSVSGMIGVACYLFVPLPWKFLFVLLFCGIGLALSIRAALISRKRQAHLRERLRKTGSHPE